VGTCSCPNATDKVCNGQCTDVLTSKTNCGNCGTVCAGAKKCVAGTCL
jgi:hypothetical protein